MQRFGSGALLLRLECHRFQLVEYVSLRHFIERLLIARPIGSVHVHRGRDSAGQRDRRRSGDFGRHLPAAHDQDGRARVPALPSVRRHATRSRRHLR